MTGLEPATNRLQICCATICATSAYLVPPARIELATPGFSVLCYYQLSYRGMVVEVSRFELEATCSQSMPSTVDLHLAIWHRFLESNKLALVLETSSAPCKIMPEPIYNWRTRVDLNHYTTIR